MKKIPLRRIRGEKDSLGDSKYPVKTTLESAPRDIFQQKEFHLLKIRAPPHKILVTGLHLGALQERTPEIFHKCKL
jgi:hypothetical protein